MLISLQKVPKTAMARKGCLLPARARYVLGYMTFGIDEPVPGKPHIPVGKPLGAHQVAELLGVRRRYVHSLLADPTFTRRPSPRLRSAHLPVLREKPMTDARLYPLQAEIARQLREQGFVETAKDGPLCGEFRFGSSAVTIDAGYGPGDERSRVKLDLIKLIRVIVGITL